MVHKSVTLDVKTERLLSEIPGFDGHLDNDS